MQPPPDSLYFAILQKHFPGLQAQDVRAFVEGNDHWVFIVKNQVTFRFPKVPRTIDPKRAAFLKHLASFCPLPVPTIEIHRDEETGFFYEKNTYIPGVSFSPIVAKTFSQSELKAVARQLGAFLSAIHSFPVDLARQLQLDEQNPYDFWEYMQDNPHAFPEYKSVVYPHVSRAEQQWIETLFTDYIALIRENPFPTRVTHADMWTYHIIVDAESHLLSGVIDFWGRIADPARDFKAFEYYGTEFVKEVYRSYSLPRDEHFEQRRLFYTGHDEVAELARQLQKGDEEKIVKQKKSFSEYMEKHPVLSWRGVL